MKASVFVRWSAFLVLLVAIAAGLFVLWLFMPWWPANVFLVFCPPGFVREPLLFGQRYCGYAPIAILTHTAEWALLIIVSLTCTFVLPKAVRLRTARWLLLLWLSAPVALALVFELSWSLLAFFVVALCIWLALAVVASMVPNPAFERDAAKARRPSTLR